MEQLRFGRGGQLGRAVFEQAVVAQHQVLQLPDEVLGEAVDGACHLLHEGGPHGDVADEPADGGVVGDEAGGELPDLAEVVQEHAGDEQVFVEQAGVVGGVVVGGDRGEPHHGERVLRQTRPEGVVVARGGRPGEEALHDGRLVEHGEEEGAHQVAGDLGLDVAAELVAEHLCGPAGGGDELVILAG